MGFAYTPLTASIQPIVGPSRGVPMLGFVQTQYVGFLDVSVELNMVLESVSPPSYFYVYVS